ncbi:hypothetical protein LJC23_07150 [Desulfovibrio sp. OttesenSCG-928-I05]|nr:hypothetical protein [Desulfovibrio sp. OttesenSCG-928-I05]
MQQRFCSCGASVWVRYFFANKRWMAFFFSDQHPMSGGTCSCPHCGQPLDIQNLL